MSYETEFPDFVLDVELPAGFRDLSWHNNAMPCWSRALADKTELMLWIDYADPALRDSAKNPRFFLARMDMTLSDTFESISTDDWLEIQEHIESYFPYTFYSLDELEEQGLEITKNIPNDDHARNWDWTSFNEINDEIFSRGEE